MSPPYAKLSFEILKISGPINANGNVLVVARNSGGRAAQIWGLVASVNPRNPPKEFSLPVRHEFDMRPRSFVDTPSTVISVPPLGEVTFFATIKSHPILPNRQGEVFCNFDLLYFGGKSGEDFSNGSVERDVLCEEYLPLLSYKSVPELKEMFRQIGATEALAELEEDERAMLAQRNLETARDKPK